PPYNFPHGRPKIYLKTFEDPGCTWNEACLKECENESTGCAHCCVAQDSEDTRIL
ncbi:hypothetical protein OS493_007136, partial [Desmophyllum pertusum]